MNTPLTGQPDPKRRVISRKEGVPYVTDSHMVTIKRMPRATKTPQPRYDEKKEMLTGDEYYDVDEVVYGKGQ